MLCILCPLLTLWLHTCVVTLVVDPQAASHGAYQGTSVCLSSYICLTISDLRVCNRFNLSDLYSFYIELNSSDPWVFVRLSGGKSSYIYCSKGREYTQEEAYNIHGRKYKMKWKMKNIYKKALTFSWFLVEDIKIPEMFLKNHKFLRTSWVSVIVHKIYCT